MSVGLSAVSSMLIKMWVIVSLKRGAERGFTPLSDSAEDNVKFLAA